MTVVAALLPFVNRQGRATVGRSQTFITPNEVVLQVWVKRYSVEYWLRAFWLPG
jgi:hypothetical protein